MKYQSELINEILEDRGHKKSSLHYESECVKSWIEENKGAYPKLCEYEGEWLNYIVEKPIGNFPYETITANPTATVSNVVPYEYKSAILKGKTDENLQSVKMPVLTTTGKNLFPDIKFIHHKAVQEGTGNIVNVTTDDWACEDYLNVPQQKTMYTNMLYIGLSWTKICFYDENKNRIAHKVNNDTIIFPENAKYWRVSAFVASENSQLLNQIMLCNSLEEARSAYEPFKSIILTVNEDVTLRSNGNIYDEVNLLTGQLTQRIDEDGEILSQGVIKTVDLTVTNQDGETLSKIKPIEGTMYIESSGTTINPTAVLEIPVEAIAQNLNSFIEGE